MDVGNLIPIHRMAGRKAIEIIIINLTWNCGILKSDFLWFLISNIAFDFWFDYHLALNIQNFLCICFNIQCYFHKHLRTTYVKLRRSDWDEPLPPSSWVVESQKFFRLPYPRNLPFSSEIHLPSTSNAALSVSSWVIFSAPQHKIYLEQNAINFW